MDTFILGVTLFTLIVLSLVTVIIYARSKFVSSGEVKITINGEKTILGVLDSIPVGEYSEIRMHVVEANIMLNDSSVYDMKIPSATPPREFKDGDTAILSCNITIDDKLGARFLGPWQWDRPDPS